MTTPTVAPTPAPAPPRTAPDLSMLIVGDGGTKKTRFLASCPKPFIFDFDNGFRYAKEFPGVGFAVFRDAPPGRPAMPKYGVYQYGTGWFKFLEKLNQIGESIDKGTCPYHTIGLDSITLLAELAMNLSLNQNNRTSPTIADWGNQIRSLQTVMEQFTSWPLLKVVTAHIQRDVNGITQATELLPLVTGKFAGKLPIYFDEVYFTEVTSGLPTLPGQPPSPSRYTFLTQSTSLVKQAKSRRNVPSGLEVSYDALRGHLESA